MNAIKGFLGAIAGTYLLGVLFISQGNLARIAEMGLDVDFGVRLQAATHDATSMVSLYLPLVVVALLIALSVCHQIAKRVSVSPAVLFALAGFVGMIALHLLMKAALTLTGFAPTRTIDGLLLQGIAGAAGSYLYYWLSGYGRPKEA
ncbi:MAG: hypothetical protein AB8B86_10590 [Pseudomonadales bacterium]